MNHGPNEEPAAEFSNMLPSWVVASSSVLAMTAFITSFRDESSFSSSSSPSYSYSYSFGKNVPQDSAEVRIQRMHGSLDPQWNFLTYFIETSIGSVTSQIWNKPSTFCDKHEHSTPIVQSHDADTSCTSQQLPNDPHQEDLFYGMFPFRQLYQPKFPYPLWDEDWDGRDPIRHLSTSTSSVNNNNSNINSNNTTHAPNASVVNPPPQSPPLSPPPQKSPTTRQIRSQGVTRHIILIRHGQYDESQKEDETRILTPLGIQQAHKTGQRIAKLLHHVEQTTIPIPHYPPETKTKMENGNPQESKTVDPSVSSVLPFTLLESQEQAQTKGKVVSIRVSNLTRAKQTADIIAQYLPSSVVRYDPDEDLNEGRPCHHIPPSHTTDPTLQPKKPRVSMSTIRQTEEGHERIERAFRKYFYRADFPVSSWTEQHHTSLDESSPSRSDSSHHVNSAFTSTTSTSSSTTTSTTPYPKHEYEILVCHGNVIRYFVCRALQIPPEAWLRFCVFNCSLTYLTIRPTGTVSCRMVGDIGHLDYDTTTFSSHYGFNW